MKTSITYTNHLGESMSFGGGSESLHYMEHGLRGWSWAHRAGAASGGPTSFYRPRAQELTFPVGIAARSGEDGLALRDRVQRLGEPDIEARTPGRLQVNGWWLPCYITGGSPGSYWMDDRYCEFELTVLADRAEWTRETEMRYVPEEALPEGGVDFPRDFPFDLRREAQVKTYDCPAAGGVDFLWRVYGPATSPYLRIGDDLHRVNAAVPDGSRLEVDTREKTAVVVSSEGYVENVYSKRERGGVGSGSYLFERIPEGTSTIAWDNTFSFDLVVYETASAPPWE